MKNPKYSPYIEHWQLDRNCTFLNHGSFGACTKEVLKNQNKNRKHFESQPVSFMIRELPYLLNESKKYLANIIGAKNENLVFVKNATEGVNTILNSIKWQKTDHLLITNQTYPACKNAAYFYAKKFGFKVDEIFIPYPVENEKQIIEPIINATNNNTRLILLDHIASPTALIFPIEKISKLLKNSNTEILIDGAHAPGAIELNIEKLGVDYYTGNCHKWLCSPKGAAFLWVKPDSQKNIYPLNVSLINNKGENFSDRFYWTGTQDYSAFLSIKTSVETLIKIAGSIEKMTIINHELNLEARKLICEKLKIKEPTPPELTSCMTSIPLPSSNTALKPCETDEIQEILFHEYRIEVPVFRFLGTNDRLMRFSCHLYNSIEQYSYLANSLKNII